MKLSISFVLLFALLAIAAALPTGKMPRKMRLKSLRATVGEDPCKECEDDFFGGCKQEETAMNSDDPHPACDKVGETHCCSASSSSANSGGESECISKKNQNEFYTCDKPSPPAEIICEKDTEGTCAVLGCDGWRNSKCDEDTDKCMCPEGTCRTEIDGHDDGYGCVNPRPWLAVVGNDETRVSEDAIAEAIAIDPVRARRAQKRQRKPRKKKVTDLPVLRTDFDEPEEAQPMYEDMKFTQNEFRQAP